ncbi:MAG: FG-GAP repeat domain-containing protein [Nitrospinaceae bacterium]
MKEHGAAAIVRPFPAARPILPLAVLWLTLVLFCVPLGCSQKRLMAKNPQLQHYLDVTNKFLPSLPGFIQGAAFAWVDQAPARDLVLHVLNRKGRSRILLLVNQGKGKFAFRKDGKWADNAGQSIRSFAVGDINGDRADDLIIVGDIAAGTSALLLLNNKKGYYYKSADQVFPAVHPGMDRVDLADIDNDRDLDMFFTGSRVLSSEHRSDKYQARILINDAAGEFQDLTRLLLPRLPPGIVGTSLADYDGDGIRDVFLVYGNGQNRLLINNGLGKFSDQTQRMLPRIKDSSAHADWADFDGDGDNDLLVVNRALGEKYRAYPGETSYFLENVGGGRFKKRSHKMLPHHPVSRVYLLDANANGLPDILILSQRGVYYLQGRGKWTFSEETVKRLPPSRSFKEMTFGDINDDGYLDIFGIHMKDRTGRLWLNRFE